MSQQENVSLFGAVTNTLKRTLSAVDNTVAMVDNAVCAGERVTYIAKSKATNMAKISDIKDTMVMVDVTSQLREQAGKLGATIDADGKISFAPPSN